jgi:acylphosphatase
MMTRRYVVRGRVQGVGYRWFVSREADRLGVRGFARNLVDGSVEVVAHGSDESLRALEQAIRKGPSYAHVSNVEKADVPHDMQLPSSFETR